MIYFSKKKIKK